MAVALICIVEPVSDCSVGGDGHVVNTHLFMCGFLFSSASWLKRSSIPSLLSSTDRRLPISPVSEYIGMLYLSMPPFDSTSMLRVCDHIVRIILPVVYVLFRPPALILVLLILTGFYILALLFRGGFCRRLRDSIS